MKKIILAIFIPIFLTSCGTTNIAQNTSTVVPTETFTPAPTATVTPTATATQIVLNVSSDVLAVLESETALNSDGSLKTNVINEEVLRNINIDPATIQSIDVQNPSLSEVVYVTNPTDGTRYLWNKEANGWAQEIIFSTDYSNWELWQVVPYDSISNGSANLSHALYVAEHPRLIPTDAPYPYYKINVTDNKDGSSRCYELSLKRRNNFMFTDSEETKVTAKSSKPFEYIGGILVVDASGNIFPTIDKANWDPTSENPEQNTPMFMAFDKATFEDWMQYSVLINALNKKSAELLAIFPPPAGTFGFNPSTFYYGNQLGNPLLASHLDPNMIDMFSESEQTDIINAINKLAEPFDVINNPKSVALENGLPDGIEYLLLYTALTSWYI